MKKLLLAVALMATIAPALAKSHHENLMLWQPGYEEPKSTETLESLLYSNNYTKRKKAYDTISDTGNSSYNQELLERLKSDLKDDEKLQVGIALLLTKDSHADELFDFVASNDNCFDPHLSNELMKIDADKLREAALKRYKSPDPKVSTLAIRALGTTPLTPASEKAMRECAQSWSPNLRRMALWALSQHTVGNIKSYAIGSTSIFHTREIALIALANSPTPEDQEYLRSMIPKTGTIPNDVLDAYLNSKRPEQVRRWLTLVKTRSVRENYDFYAFSESYLESDEMLAEVQDTLKSTPNIAILRSLPRVLSERTDQESLDILTKLLSHKDKEVRRAACNSLRRKNNPVVKERISKLFTSQSDYTNELTWLAIETEIDTLQAFHQTLLDSCGNDKKLANTKYAALNYLARFPNPEHKEFFRTLLKSSESIEYRRQAVTGLGNLRDCESVPLIIKTMSEAYKGESEYDEYLRALGKIKGEQAKFVLEGLQSDENKHRSSLARKLLAAW